MTWVRLRMVISKCPFTYTEIRFTVHKMYIKFYLNYQPGKGTATFSYSTVFSLLFLISLHSTGRKSVIWLVLNLTIKLFMPIRIFLQNKNSIIICKIAIDVLCFAPQSSVSKI